MHSLGRRWDTGVGKSSSIYPNIRILIEKPLAVKATQKIWIKSELDEFTLIVKYQGILKGEVSLYH
jgi:hypothetical protein